jgi:hypothetical protein
MGQSRRSSIYSAPGPAEGPSALLQEWHLTYLRSTGTRETFTALVAPPAEAGRGADNPGGSS